MDKLEHAKILLNQIGMPQKQQGVLCALALLAMAGLKRGTWWSDATNEWIRIHDIIRFIANNYNVIYAENSRETFRKQAMHPFRTAAIIEDNGMPTNSPNYCYRITNEFLNVIKEVNEEDYPSAAEPGIALTMFFSNHESLSQIYASKKRMQKMPVRINSQDFTFSPGKHNELQKAIIEEFAPRFAPNSECLYVGDTIRKDLVKNTEKLSELGFQITLHDKMPDVVLYREDKNWIYFIESITSVGPMDPKRIGEIEAMTRNVTAGKIFISAFLDFATFKKFSDQLAWETEVWIADMPDHMIHLNGDRFIGPRKGY
ncbi:BsuBI/PstI family type II restriction endonuclease [Lepagella muris]|jgi:hypothetical protein|uniref:Restriction endonuclease n=1 Tax=Lepagella muris TaxID=3032870 RepID=A0AC61RD08_9BACT|nr:BsuBI/PstI family type II restriction endonuclease [Lepagella muris]ROT03516.1 restriction endonuclease [Muribaculaceae bacterium Isolate-037 (Harlan)]TGY77374.1 restriction endonuclease [Lepagella muris]THG49588.1 restriction endonuclease [Bacteroidales bacterium]TKC54689.1 restriction endonuclease [Bacteroidales bacterium]